MSDLFAAALGPGRGSGRDDVAALAHATGMDEAELDAGPALHAASDALLEACAHVDGWDFGEHTTRLGTLLAATDPRMAAVARHAAEHPDPGSDLQVRFAIVDGGALRAWLRRHRPHLLAATAVEQRSGVNRDTA